MQQYNYLKKMSLAHVITGKNVMTKSDTRRQMLKFASMCF